MIQVDPQDAHLLSERTWYVVDGYVRTHDGVYLHRLIMGAEVGQVVDHRNGDTCDNSTGVKGVSVDKRDGAFVAYVQRDGRRVSSRHTTLESARSWVVAHRAHMHGEYANDG